MEKKSGTVTAFAPASVGNITCGFDVLGMAVDQPGDEVSVCFNGTETNQIKDILNDGGKLPRRVAENTAGIAVLELQQALEDHRGVDILINKRMPLGSGMGSSAASAVAAAVAVNELYGNPFSKKELLPFTMQAEAMACGAAHADNVAPSLLGGIVLIRSYEPLDIVELPVPDALFCSLVHPDVKILTADARGIIPEKVDLKDAIQQIGDIAGFVAGLYENDLELIGRSLNDTLAEPYRTSLILHFSEVREAVLAEGALNCGVSGSGPSIYAFSESIEVAENVSIAIQNVFESNDLKSESYTSRVNSRGAYIML